MHFDIKSNQLPIGIHPRDLMPPGRDRSEASILLRAKITALYFLSQRGSTRSVASALGISRSQVHRYLAHYVPAEFPELQDAVHKQLRDNKNEQGDKKFKRIASTNRTAQRWAQEHINETIQLHNEEAAKRHYMRKAIQFGEIYGRTL